jgi:ABC-type molybdate transport system substrate-binding protein
MHDPVKAAPSDCARLRRINDKTINGGIMTIVRRCKHWLARRPSALAVLLLATVSPLGANAAETLNAYSIWPENWARPMFEEFEKATGIKVNFVRFSSGEALTRIIAEKGTRRSTCCSAVL